MASVSRVLLGSAQLTGSGDGSGVSLESSSTAFVGWFKCSAINAATTLDVKIEHSPNKTDWKTLCTFAQLVGVTGSEVKQITDGVLPFVRYSATLAGVTKDATVEVALYFDKLR